MPRPIRPTAWLTDDVPDEAAWHALTRTAEKRTAYTTDLYFREAWADLLHTTSTSRVELLRQHALLIFKPDGVVSGRVPRTLTFVAEHGFDVVAAFPVRMDRHTMRELWRYDWDVYPVDRLQLANYMYRTTGTVAVVLRRAAADPVPATVQLSDLKGSSNPASRGPEHLRSVLRAPNSVLNFVHVADEPADIVREVGIFLERPDRLDLWSALETGAQDQTGPRDAMAVVDAVLAAAPQHDLDPEASLARLSDSGHLTDLDKARVLEVFGTERSLRWDELRELVDPEDPTVDTWDFISLATEVLGLERPGARPLMSAATGPVWRDEPDTH